MFYVVDKSVHTMFNFGYFYTDFLYVLDTGDCVVEKYTVEEIKNFPSQMKVYGIVDEDFQHFSCIPITKLLGGDIECRDKQVFYRGRTVFSVEDITDGADRLVTVFNSSSKPFLFIGARQYCKYRHIRIQWAERHGNVYVIIFRVIIENFKDGGRFWIRFHTILNEKGEIGVFKIDGTDNKGRLSLKTERGNYGCSKSDLAKLRLLGEL